MRKIAVIVGSISDLKQCQNGLLFLKSSKVEVVGVYVMSQHRNTLDVQSLLWKIHKEADVAIIGAGWANHLTGCCDAFLRYNLRTTNMPVIGVAFEDRGDQQHTRAAILSISEVPGTQVIYQDCRGKFIGSMGFLWACDFAAYGNLPEIKLPTPKETLSLTLDQAYEMASK